MKLRTYQESILQKLRPGSLAVAPTGAGKSVCIAEWAHRWGWLGMLIVGHTGEIVDQISNKLRIPHDLIIPGQRRLRHAVAVARIDSLRTRDIDLSRYRFLQIDEAHHVAEGNKWGRLMEAMMHHAYCVGWSATPIRLDRRPLGPFFPGGLVQGPSTKELVKAGWITPLHVYGPPAAIDRTAIAIDADGELNGRSMRAALASSTITGDLAASYLRFAAGRRGLTFAASVELAEQHAAGYRAAGIPAAVVTGKTRDRGRYEQALLSGEISQIVVVGVYGEGFDLPSVEVVSLARPSESRALVWQQIGRVRRPAPGKRMGIVIDHVGNVRTHGLPDYVGEWALDEQARHSQGGAALLQTCPACFGVYEAAGAAACPYCGAPAAPAEASAGRNLGVGVGGLEAYTTAELEAMTAAARAAVRHPPNRRPEGVREVMIFRRMRERVEAQAILRRELLEWEARCGTGADQAVTLFRTEFGLHPLEAMALGGRACAEMTEKLRLWRR